MAATQKQTHAKNLRRATAIVRNSLFMSIGLTIIQAFGGYVTNIIPLIGSAIGSFSDIIATSAIFIGLKFSQKKANKQFKYGYHRIETLISLCISIVIIIAGYKVFVESIKRFFITAETGSHGFGIIAVIISIAVSLFTFFIQRTIAIQINSNALRASAYDKRNDAIVGFGVFGSVVADKFKIPYVEGGVGIVIALIILYSGFKYGKDALLYLLDYWDDPVVTAQIKQILKKSRVVMAVKNIRLRHVGTYIFGEAFLSVNPFASSTDLRDEIHRLDKKVEESVSHLGDLVLYIDPPKPAKIRIALPIMSDSGLDSMIAENAGEKFQFLFVDVLNGKIKNTYAKPEQFSIDRIMQIATFLSDEKTNILISSMLPPLLFYNLRLKNIKVYPHFLGVKDVKNTIKLLLLDI